MTELPNFPSDLEDLQLEPIKSDPNLAPNIQLDLIITPPDNIKEEQGDEEMKGNYLTVSLLWWMSLNERQMKSTIDGNSKVCL